jgi:hypothetical protein
MGRFFCTCSAFHANNDVAVVGTFGPCPNQQMVIPSRDQNNNLLGKFLFENGESVGNIMTTLAPKDRHRIYQIGPLKSDSDTKQPPQWQPMVNASYPRPRPTSEINRVLYLASHCVPYRDNAASMISKFVGVYHRACRPTPQTPRDQTASNAIRLLGIGCPTTSTTISGHSKNTNTVL